MTNRFMTSDVRFALVVFLAVVALLTVGAVATYVASQHAVPCGSMACHSVDAGIAAEVAR